MACLASIGPGFVSFFVALRGGAPLFPLPVCLQAGIFPLTDKDLP
jgi:hypothetical protein